MGKLNIKISPPGSSVMPNTGGHTDGIQKGGHAHGSPTARVSLPPKGASLGRLPLQSPPANVTGQRIGQPNPQVGAAASKKPNRKGGAAFYGES